MELSILHKIEALNLIPGDTIYFVGIGGIGMSAVARYFHAKKFKVCGYDKNKTVLTDSLQTEGIEIVFDDSIDALKKEAKLVIYTPAIPSNSIQLQYYLNHNYLVIKRSDVLQWITNNTYTIAIAGTHGKTTTSSMVAHLLTHTGYGCTAFLGGIAANYNTNYWHKPTIDNKDIIVVEADEYDRSFLKLNPNIAIITSVDADHLDIYGTPEEVVNTFVDFSKKVDENGCLIVKNKLTCHNRFTAKNIASYDLEDATANTYVTNLQVKEGYYLFDVVSTNWQLKGIELFMGGLHNIENCLAAINVAKYLQIEDHKIREAIKEFKGVKRRFEYILNPNTNSISNKSIKSNILIDDYAHHPQELKALISGVRSLFGNQKLCLVFQPHLFSRTKDLVEEFAKELSLVDELILLPIYPARELPIEGVTSNWLLEKINCSQKSCLDKAELVSYMQKHQPQLVVMAGAGDIDALVNIVKEKLTS